MWKDSDGYYYMLGRSDDVINIAGEKINPQEIETEADKVEGINDTACLCVDDKGSAFGKKLVLIAAGSRSSGKRLIHELRETLDKYKVPEEVRFTDYIPRNSIGKIERKSLFPLWESLENKGRI